MKKGFLIFSIIIFLINTYQVSATGGGLRKNSIKTCPDGVTYGMHSDGNGGKHWHKAATNGTNYYATGEAIYGDPCPNSVENKGTAESTNGSSNNYNGSQYTTQDTPTVSSPTPVEESSTNNSYIETNETPSSDELNNDDSVDTNINDSKYEDTIDSNEVSETSSDKQEANNDDDYITGILGLVALGGIGHLILKKKK